MRVFMLGWEFPPFISGGLGTACYGLTKAMSGIGTDVIFVLPRPVATPFSTHVRLVSPRANSPLATPATESRVDEFEHVVFRSIDAQLADPYQTPADYDVAIARAEREAAASLHRTTTTTTTTSYFEPANAPSHVQAPAPSGGHNSVTPGFIGGASSTGGSPYAGDMFAEITRYAALATEIARQESFDVVHAHDWMTFPAGLAVAAVKGVPLVVHVHSTEFDRSGLHIDERIYDIERRGMHGAMKVIAVSYLTKNLISHHYSINPDKVEVIYNAIDVTGHPFDEEEQKLEINRDEKIVLFLGRITMQKGPEYFVAAAKKVLEVMDNVKFVMAGSGDMIRRTIEMAAAMGIGHKVLFTGFLRGSDVERVFKMADLYVMPSVSEPFGIAPLEAMSHDVPVIVSKQSGVSEVLQHALKVDFWDVNEMANKIVAVLRHPPLASTLRQHGSFEVRRRNWTDAARSVVQVYEAAVGMVSGKR